MLEYESQTGSGRPMLGSKGRKMRLELDCGGNKSKTGDGGKVVYHAPSPVTEFGENGLCGLRVCLIGSLCMRAFDCVSKKEIK